MEEKIAKKIWINIMIAVAVMLYFIGINVLYNNIELSEIVMVLKVMSIVIMITSIIIFEVAYKKDNGVVAITGIEVLIIAMHSLSVMHVVEVSAIDFNVYIVTSSYLFSIYFVFKSMIIYTIEKRKYLKSLSDIKEIVINEPIKKEAKKNNKNK